LKRRGDGGPEAKNKGKGKGRTRGVEGKKRGRGKRAVSPNWLIREKGETEDVEGERLNWYKDDIPLRKKQPPKKKASSNTEIYHFSTGAGYGGIRNQI